MQSSGHPATTRASRPARAMPSAAGRSRRRSSGRCPPGRAAGRSRRRAGRESAPEAAVATRCRHTPAGTHTRRHRGPPHATVASWTAPVLLREIHLRRLSRPRRLELEVRAWPLAEQFSRQHLREAPDIGVVAVHCLVVVLPRDRDAVLRPLELVLQRAEVLVGLELRVVLGDGEQAAERGRQLPVGLRHLLQVAALDRPRELGPGLRHFGEDRTLLLRIRLDRFDQVGDEIGAALQLDLDLRRRDLIPNLVETVKAYAKQERTVFTEVAEARAKLAGAVQSGDLQQMAEANRQLTAPLGRLLAIAENYPQLKSNENFRALQDQLEGTENRIAVARQDYNEAVNRYNAYIRRFPQVLTAKLLGKGPRPYFELQTPGAAQAPKVDFSK